MGVRRTALVDDGYHSGILPKSVVRRLRGPRMRVSTGPAPGAFGIFPDRIASKAREKVDETDGTDAAKEHPGHARAEVSANRLVVELVMEALDHRE